MIGIYKITSPTGKIYVGQSINIEKRFYQYKKLHCKGQAILYNSFIKHGVEKHKFEILEYCEISELNDKERYYQDLYSSVGKNGLNCSLTKSSGRSGKHSEETKLKISISNKGRKRSNETKLKISTSKINPSDETRLKMSLSQTGRKRSNETRLKLSLKKIGVKASIETKNKMSASQTGRIHSEKTKLKMSLSAKNSKYSESRRKIIIDLQTGIFYKGVKEASIVYEIRESVLKCYLNGKSKNKTNLIYA